MTIGHQYNLFSEEGIRISSVDHVTPILWSSTREDLEIFTHGDDSGVVSRNFHIRHVRPGINRGAVDIHWSQAGQDVFRTTNSSAAEIQVSFDGHEISVTARNNQGFSIGHTEMISLLPIAYQEICTKNTVNW